MGKNSKRKQKPQPPKWFNQDTDDCWWCNNRQNCGNCKMLKKFKKTKERGIEL